MASSEFEDFSKDILSPRSSPPVVQNDPSSCCYCVAPLDYRYTAAAAAALKAAIATTFFLAANNAYAPLARPGSSSLPGQPSARRERR